MTKEEIAINQRIKQLRLSLCINQREFCKLLSLSIGYISAIEVNRRPSNERLIKLIVSEFGINEEWLRTGNGEMLIDQEKDERISRLVALFNDLSRDNQDVILEMITILRKKESKQKTGLRRSIETISLITKLYLFYKPVISGIVAYAQ